MASRPDLLDEGTDPQIPHRLQFGVPVCCKPVEKRVIVAMELTVHKRMGKGVCKKGVGVVSCAHFESLDDTLVFMKHVGKTVDQHQLVEIRIAAMQIAPPQPEAGCEWGL